MRRYELLQASLAEARIRRKKQLIFTHAFEVPKSVLKSPRFKDWLYDSDKENCAQR